MSPTERREYNRAWMERDRRARGVRPWSEHPKKVKALRPLKRTPEEGRAAARERYARLRLELIEYQKAWAKANPERVTLVKREAHVRRSGRIKTTRVTRISYQRVLARDGWTCGICHVPILTLGEIHFDHIIPLSAGGPHVEANIQPSHAKCNLRKAASLGP